MSVLLVAALLLAQAGDQSWQAQQRELAECRKLRPDLHGLARVNVITRCLDQAELRHREEGRASEAVKAAARRAAAEGEAAAKAAREAERREEDARALAEYQLRQAAEERQAAEDAKRMALEEAAEAQAFEARRRRCGRDFNRVEVGQPFDRVRDCAGPFVMVGQTQSSAGVVSVYRAPGGLVRVVGGKVTAWLRSP